MFLEELVCPWLLLAPITSVRRVGVLMQLPLQILIMFTGTTSPQNPDCVTAMFFQTGIYHTIKRVTKSYWYR
jgi:hypothetical protein